MGFELAKVIKIKYHTDIPPLEINEKGDWIDLRAAEDMKLWAGHPYFIPLGVSMELPAGYEAHLSPRSSSFKKWGIIQTNGVGVIDNSYCGDNDIWMMPVYATRFAEIKKGDRICQFRIMPKQPDVLFKTVEHLGNEDRGGFGSTGTI